MPTLQDIATVAGTSKQTVSVVLSGRAKAARISERTAVQIQHIADELGYVGNWRAKAFARQRTQTIGVLFARLSPFKPGISMPLVHDLSVELQQRGYQLLFIPVLQPDGEVIPGLEDQRIDAAVIVEPLLPVYERILPRLKIPVVLANLTTDHPLRQYVFDDAQGARDLLDHLYDLGHRRIELWMGPNRNPLHYSSHARIGAFERWVEAHPDVRGEVVVEPVEDYATRILDRRHDADRPTAVVGYKSLLAMQLMHGLLEAGLRVPADLSLAGFDDLDACALVNPSLTVVATPIADLGRCAAKELIAAVERDQPPPAQRRVFPERLVPRRSTAAPNLASH